MLLSVRHCLIPYIFSFVHVDLKSALGKKRRDGKSALPQPLTAIQRVHIGRLVDKYGDDYKVGYCFYFQDFQIVR